MLPDDAVGTGLKGNGKHLEECQRIHFFKLYVEGVLEAIGMLLARMYVSGPSAVGAKDEAGVPKC